MKTEKKSIVDSLVPTMQKIKAKLEARTPMLWLVSNEEQRIQGQIMQKIGLATGREIIVWSCSQGLLRYDGSVIDSNCKGLTQALDFIFKYKTPVEYTSTVFILRDPHIHINSQVARLVRDLYTPLTMGQLSETKLRNKTSSIIFLSGRVAHIANGIVDGLEPSLNDIIDIIDIPLPTKQDLLTYVELGLKVAKKKYSSNNKCTYKLDYSSTELNSFATSLQGLTIIEALRAISESFPLNHKICVDSLQEKKKQIVKRGGLLEVVDNLPVIEQVGGLDEVKKFISLYNGQFTEEAEIFGLEPLKAILFVGIPGGGKSLCSKALAALWKLPCLRLDMGKIFGGIVGQSEMNMRQVIKIAESSAPCILLLDEIEKQLSGTASSGSTDGGTTARVFGTLLTAMEEGLKGVCISATANSVAALPPELIRRFDEVFYVDLPVKQERETIFNIHIHKRRRKVEDFDIAKLVEATHGFTGSEIEKSIKVGLAMAWHNEEELSTDHIISAIRETRPLSKIMAHKIEESRKWAQGRARRASSLTEAGEKKDDSGFVDLSLGLDLAELTGNSGREEKN